MYFAYLYNIKKKHTRRKKLYRFKSCFGFVESEDEEERLVCEYYSCEKTEFLVFYVIFFLLSFFEITFKL